MDKGSPSPTCFSTVGGGFFWGGLPWAQVFQRQLSKPASVYAILGQFELTIQKPWFLFLVLAGLG